MAHRGTLDSEKTEHLGGGGDGGYVKEQEENNNEVDALSKELSGMGCIVDAVRMQPALCVDASAYGDSGGESFRDQGDGASDEDAYLSEEFDVSASDAESEPGGARAAAAGRAGEGTVGGAAEIRSSLSTLRATRSSVDTRSVSRYGSLPVPRTNRVNMSFSNSRLREIERDNRTLLNKIMSARGSKRASVAPSAAPATPAAAAPSGYARRQQQRRIDHDNMILLRKIQRVKSSSCSLRR